VLPQIPIEIKKDLTLEVKLVRVLDHSEKELKNKKIPMIKILWRSTQIEKGNRKREFETRRKYLSLFL